jgi:hypothetical protein
MNLALEVDRVLSAEALKIIITKSLASRLSIPDSFPVTGTTLVEYKKL